MESSMYSKASSYAVFGFRKKNVHPEVDKNPKNLRTSSVFWNQFKTVQLQGPSTQRLHISRPCCIKVDQVYAYFSLAGLCFQHKQDYKDHNQSHTIGKNNVFVIIIDNKVAEGEQQQEDKQIRPQERACRQKKIMSQQKYVD